VVNFWNNRSGFRQRTLVAPGQSLWTHQKSSDWNGTVKVEKDWVDEDATAHRGPDECVSQVPFGRLSSVPARHLFALATSAPALAFAGLKFPLREPEVVRRRAK
jgi:hypothetical protein